MDTNMPALGGTGAAQRGAGSYTTAQASSEKVTDNQLTRITSTNDLKLAELRGESIAISEEQLIKAIDRAIKAADGKSTSLQFSVHKQTNIISVKVLDSSSGEVIREIPPEKTLDFVAKLWEMAGVLIDEKA
jgi:flagellar protein FlaG